MPPLLKPNYPINDYPLYRSKSLEIVFNEKNDKYRNWSLNDDYWYDCYMGTPACSRTKNLPLSMWNYPYSSWLRHKKYLYDLPSIYPSYYSMHYNRYNDNARYLYYHNYFTYYSPLNRPWLKCINYIQYGN